VIGAWNGFPIERQSNLELKCEALMNPGLVPNEQVMFNIESTMSFLEVIGCYASASSDSCWKNCIRHSCWVSSYWHFTYTLTFFE